MLSTLKNPFLFFMIISFNLSCIKLSSLPENYYQNDENIVGGQKPSPPTLFPIESRADGKYLVWSKSIDPDTNAEVPRYYIYIFIHQIPNEKNIYELGPQVLNQNYLIQPRQYRIPADLLPSKYYFAVSGYDGDTKTGRESLVSNFRELIISN